MKIIPTSLPDVLLIEPVVYGDDRGLFMESWNNRVFDDLGIKANFVQDNYSFSRKGILRGLHNQLNCPQGKLVWAIEGEILDVAVDLRKNSPTFGQSTSMRLSGKNFLRAWIPPGFAHGFYVLSDTVHFCYKCTDYYSPQNEQVVIWNDPDLAIDWQIPPGSAPLLSARDLKGVPFRSASYYT